MSHARSDANVGPRARVEDKGYIKTQQAKRSVGHESKRRSTMSLSLPSRGLAPSFQRGKHYGCNERSSSTDSNALSPAQGRGQSVLPLPSSPASSVALTVSSIASASSSTSSLSSSSSATTSPSLSSSCLTSAGSSGTLGRDARETMSSARNSTHEIKETLDAAFAQLALAADGGLAQLEQPASLALAGEQNRVLRIPGRALHETKTREFAAMLGDIRGDPERFVREIEARRQRDRECREDGEVGIGHASDLRSGDGVDEDEEKKVEEKKEDESSSPATDASETSQSTTSSNSNSNSRLKAFKVHSILGRGSFSTVYAATKLSDGTKYALKRVRLTGLESDQSRSKSVKEIRVLQSLDHPNIIKCFEHFHAPEGLFIVLEWAVAGDLKRMLKRVRAKQSRFHERVIWNYFVQISCALAFMHERRMIHRDIKPANVFVMPDGRIKLGDLGLSRALSQATVRAYSKVGTPLYMAPEVLQGAGHDFKSDVWSLGCLLYELAMLHSPFEVGCKTMKTLFTRILHAEYFPLSRTYSDRFARIVAFILLTEPEDRPSARDVFRLAQERVQYYEHADGRPEEGHAAAPERSNHAHARDVRTPRRIQGPHMSRHSFCEGTASRTF